MVCALLNKSTATNPQPRSIALRNGRIFFIAAGLKCPVAGCGVTIQAFDYEALLDGHRVTCRNSHIICEEVVA
jgi:hypothetical protein